MNLEIIPITPENVASKGLFCIKDMKAEGFLTKKDWFDKRYNEGLRLHLLKVEGKQEGFVEFVTAEEAWRPVNAPGFLFIQCLLIISKKVRSKGLGGKLIAEAEKYAREAGMKGICTFASKGSWMTGKELFEKNGFEVAARMGRFDLMVKKFDPAANDPQFIDWRKNANQYKGWHVFYSDQCPWHPKGVEALCETALDKGFHIEVHKLNSAKDAQNGPSGFGTFSLVNDGELIEDHYISKTRFLNILKKRGF